MSPLKKRKAIALLTSNPETKHGKLIIDGISGQCRKYGYDLAVFCAMTSMNITITSYKEGEQNIFRLPNYDLFDGVILDTAMLTENNGTALLDELYATLKSSCKAPVVALDMPVGDIPMISHKNEDILREMCRHAIEVHGRKHLCLITGPKEDYAARSRMEIFADEVRRHGLELKEEHIVYSDFWYSGGSALAADIGEGRISAPDAIICGNDYLAIGAIYKLGKYGIRVPEDIVVLGFEGTDEGAGNTISVSSYEPNDASSAAKCVDYIRSVIEPDREIMPYESEICFHAGMSCGCQPDYTRAIQSLHDHIYFSAPNYADEEMFDHVDMGLLMESYMYEEFTGADTPDECLGMINLKTFLIFPFVNFYICLREDWTDEHADDTVGYPKKMKIVTANTTVGESYFHTDKESITFDTALMLPRMFENDDSEPSVYYFSPIHFGRSTLGYAVMQRTLTDKHRLNLVFRNWLRFVNNALEMMRSKMKLLKMSVRDEMTGALNRRGMAIELDRLLKSANADDSLFVCVIDMDRLKYINDTFGHTEGDTGIKTVSTAASSVTFNNEVLVRAGGDEFYIIGVGKYDEASGEKRIAAFERIIAALTAANEKPYPITASLGIAVRALSELTDYEDVINEADEIMYQNKTAKKCQRS